MKKIMLCGALQGEKGNFGDDLLRQILVDQLRSWDKTVQIADYSKSTTWKELADCEYFLYIPGGFLGYIEKWYSGSFKKTMQRLIYYYWPGIKAVLLRKKIIFLAQGIGPYEYPVLKRILGLIADKAILLTVRDNKGKRLLREAGCKKPIFVTADTAQTLLAHSFIKECVESRKIKEQFAGKIIIFVHYVGTVEYQNHVVKALKELFFDREDVAFVVGADGVCNADYLKMFANRFPRTRCLTYKYKNVSQLVTILNSVDCVITGKFHVGIVGCTLSKSVISLSVQYAKNSLYYEQIGYPERCMDIFKASYPEIKNKIADCYKESVRIPQEVLEKAHSNYAYYLKNALDVEK